MMGITLSAIGAPDHNMPGLWGGGGNEERMQNTQSCHASFLTRYVFRGPKPAGTKALRALERSPGKESNVLLSHTPVLVLYRIPAGPRLWSDLFCFDLAKQRVSKVYLSSVRVPRTLNKLSCPHKKQVVQLQHAEAHPQPDLEIRGLRVRN